jgi:antitoxin YefM
MAEVTYTEFRENLKGYMDQSCDTHEPIIVKRQNGEDMVMLPRSDFEPLDETAYLMRSPANAAMLREALATDPKDYIRFESMEELDAYLAARSESR